MKETRVPIVKVDNCEQPSKACWPILLMLLGIVSEIKPLQYENA